MVVITLVTAGLLQLAQGWDPMRLRLLLIVAVGWPNAVTADMVSEGTVVIDVGVNRTDD